jgi:hypothetical protein
MHLFASERPEASPGRKALLLDGSAVPQVMVFPSEKADTITLTIFLRSYNESSGFSYSQFTVDITTNGLLKFMCSYRDDPESTLEGYFGWKPQVVVQSKPKSPNFADTAEAKRWVEDLL